MPSVTPADPKSTPSEAARREILVDAGLFVNDPASYPNLADAMDPSAEIDPDFQPVAYDTRKSTGVMVHCSICSQKQPHFDGAIIRLKDNKVGLVGNSCGKRHFFGNDGWDSLQSRMRVNEERAIFLARFGPAKDRIDALEPLLAHWSAKLEQVHAFRCSFLRIMPKLFDNITGGSQGGVLSVDEEIAVPYLARDGSIEHRTELRTRPVCRIEATWFFQNEQPHQDIDRNIEKLKRALSYLRPDATPNNVRAVQRMLLDCRRSVEAIAVKQAQLASLASVHTVSRLAEWANALQKSQGTYRAAGSVLAWEVNGQNPAIINFNDLPTNLSDYSSRISELWPSLK